MRRRCNTARKARYLTVRHAERAAEILRTPGAEKHCDRRLEVYLCPGGRHFHLRSVTAGPA
jgi:hypothetical protein